MITEYKEYIGTNYQIHYNTLGDMWHGEVRTFSHNRLKSNYYYHMNQKEGEHLLYVYNTIPYKNNPI